jgi:hypothetical protein
LCDLEAAMVPDQNRQIVMPAQHIPRALELIVSPEPDRLGKLDDPSAGKLGDNALAKPLLRRIQVPEATAAPEQDDGVLRPTGQLFPRVAAQASDIDDRIAPPLQVSELTEPDRGVPDVGLIRDADQGNRFAWGEQPPEHAIDLGTE